jgi:hypothetical protein
MVKRDQIESKMKSYVDENKLSAFQALYMWSKGISSKTIAGVLSNIYDSAEGLNTITADISGLQIRGPSESIELTNEEVGVVVRDVFRKLQQPLLDKITQNLVQLTESEKNLLLAMINSSLFEKETIKPDDLKLAYNAIFGQSMKDRDFTETLSYLEKLGIIYCDRSYRGIETIIIPEYIYSIQTQIEAKLPRVVTTEGKEKSS